MKNQIEVKNEYINTTKRMCISPACKNCGETLYNPIMTFNSESSLDSYYSTFTGQCKNCGAYTTFQKRTTALKSLRLHMLPTYSCGKL